MENLKKWDRVHCFLMFGVGILYWFLQFKTLLLFATILSFIYLWISERKILGKLSPFAGYANWVTLIRLIGIIAIFSVAYKLNNIPISIVLVILISLDGLDGFLARKFKQETSFGATFDMETDSIFVCLVSILLVERGLTGYWIILIGFLRYIYVVIIYLLQMHYFAEKRTKFGPTIAVILFVAVILPFALPESIYMPCLIIASTLVVFSFSWSFYLLTVEKKKLNK